MCRGAIDPPGQAQLGLSTGQAMKVSQVGVSPPKLGGVAATQRKFREASLAGADGVVPKPKRFGCVPRSLGSGTTLTASPYRARASRPSVRAEVAIASFLGRTATPPNLGGDTLPATPP